MGKLRIVTMSVTLPDISNREALNNALFDPILGLYTTNASAPLQEGLGLRQYYEFGLYSYCGYINSTAGTCGNHTAGSQFRPYDALTSDMIANFSSITSVVLTNTTLIDSKYLGQSSRAAYWMLLLGAIFTAVTFIAYVLLPDFRRNSLLISAVELQNIMRPSSSLGCYP
ncbi:hypothetical protein AX15_000929 [Amanita polypyramis BW_CC]|nr:hypothetical protein AX15_000929 [Amanita polypyramis BW_CC]